MLQGHSRSIALGRLLAIGLVMLLPFVPIARADILIAAVGALTAPTAYIGEQHQQGVEAALTEEGRANVFRICGRDDQQGTITGNHLAEQWREARIFRQQGYEPEGYSLYSSAAVRVWAGAVAKAGTAETQTVTATLRANEFETVLGKTDFNEKGDVKQPGFDWYVWQGGRYLPSH